MWKGVQDTASAVPSTQPSAAGLSEWLDRANTLATNFAHAANAAHITSAAAPESVQTTTFDYGIGTLTQIMAMRAERATQESQTRGAFESQIYGGPPVRTLPQLPVFPFAASVPDQQPTQTDGSSTFNSTERVWKAPPKV